MFYEFTTSAGYRGRVDDDHPAEHYRDGDLVAPVEAFAAITAVAMGGVPICMQEIDVRGTE